MKRLTFVAVAVFTTAIMLGNAFAKQEFSNPMMTGKPHEFLKAMAGEFTVKSTLMNSPNPTKGTATARLLHDGRYLELNTRTTIHEMPMHLTMILGHNNFKKTYQFMLIGNTTTAIESASGTIDEDEKTLSVKGIMEDAMAGKREVEHRFTLTDEGFDFATFDTLPDGKQLKILEMSCSRTP